MGYNYIFPYTGFILCFHTGDTRAFFPHTDFITWCEQASSAAQVCKEINEA